MVPRCVGMEADLLVLSRKKDEDVFLIIGNEVMRVTILGIETNRVKVGVEANPNVTVLRGELMHDQFSHLMHKPKPS